MGCINSIKTGIRLGLIDELSDDEKNVDMISSDPLLKNTYDLKQSSVLPQIYNSSRNSPLKGPSLSQNEYKGMSLATQLGKIDYHVPKISRRAVPEISNSVKHNLIK